MAGEEGSQHTIDTALFLMNGFALSDDEVFDLMWPWNAEKCDPLWPEHELRRKIDAASGKAHRRGDLLDQDRPGWADRPRAPRRPRKPRDRPAFVNALLEIEFAD